MTDQISQIEAEEAEEAEELEEKEPLLKAGKTAGGPSVKIHRDEKGEIKNVEVIPGVAPFTRKCIHPKISHSIEEMMLKYNLLYYAEFMSFINFYESNRVPTAGVNVSTRMNYFWNREFYDNMSQEEVNFVNIHELFHLLFDHMKRTKYGHFNPFLSNVAQDMIINEIIIEDMPKGFAKFPEIGLRLPKEYTEERVFEILYAWLQKQKEKYDQWKKEQKQKQKQQKQKSDEKSDEEKGDQKGCDQDGEGDEKEDPNGKPKKSGNKESDEGSESNDQGKGQGKDREKEEGKGGGNCPVSEQLQNIFDAMERGDAMSIGQLDQHLEDQGVSEDIRKQVIQDVMNNLKNRGLETADVESMLGKLRKSQKDYLKVLRSQFAQIKGKYKSRSFKRPNRRGYVGIKGSVKFGKELVCILDTSGSMFGHFEKILSYMLHGDQIVHVIQIDTHVKAHKTLTTKQEFQKLKINGGGGTVLQPAIDYMKSHKKLKSMNLVVLTDGCTDTLDFSGVKQTLIISCGQPTPVSAGKYKEVVVQEN